MRSEAFEAQKTHLGCRYEQREYERGPHVRGARGQVGLNALRPVVQREWQSASQLRRPSVLNKNKGRPKSPSGQCWCIWRAVRCAGLLVRIMRRLVMTLMRWLSLFAFSGLHRRSIPERARVADGDDQLRLKPLTHRALPNAFEQQYYENLRSVLDFIS